MPRSGHLPGTAAHCSLKFPHKQAEQLGKLMPHKVEGPTELWHLLGGRPGWKTQLLRTGLLGPGTRLTLAMANGGTLVSPICGFGASRAPHIPGEGRSLL